MKVMNFLKRVKCKVFICCKSKCSLNDTSGDGIVDEFVIEQGDKEIVKVNI